jgi:nuclear-control-of-ATPase protein 2
VLPSQSLERMAISLAQDKLLYDSQQLSSLSEQIRMGDLTPVLQVYEDDIKRPLRSALTGTLLRSVFIQVQKAKVCIHATSSPISINHPS